MILKFSSINSTFYFAANIWAIFTVPRFDNKNLHWPTSNNIGKLPGNNLDNEKSPLSTVLANSLEITSKFCFSVIYCYFMKRKIDWNKGNFLAALYHVLAQGNHYLIFESIYLLFTGKLSLKFPVRDFLYIPGHIKFQGI